MIKKTLVGLGLLVSLTGCGHENLYEIDQHKHICDYCHNNNDCLPSEYCGEVDLANGEYALVCINPEDNVTQWNCGVKKNNDW